MPAPAHALAPLPFPAPFAFAGSLPFARPLTLPGLDEVPAGEATVACAYETGREVATPAARWAVARAARRFDEGEDEGPDEGPGPELEAGAEPDAESAEGGFDDECEGAAVAE